MGPNELLAQAIPWFFSTALPSIGQQLAQLPEASVHLGSYTRWAGGPVPTTLGRSLTPDFALRVSPPLPIANGAVSTAALPAVPADGPATHLLWTAHVADPAVDDEAEIVRVMRDLDSFATLFTQPGLLSAADETPGGNPAATTAAAVRAPDWARAVVAARGALPADLAQLTEVPAAFRTVVGDVAALRQVLQHFFTYDAQGRAYRRWTGAGRDPGNPAHLTPEYGQANVTELRLQREQLYLYGVVHESLLSGPGTLGGAPAFREFVLRIDPTEQPDQLFTLAALHSVRSTRDSAPYADLVFFSAADGVGLPVARSLQAKMGAGLLHLLSGADTARDRNAFLAGAETVTSVTDDAPHQVVLNAVLDGAPALPPGAVATGDGTVQTVILPLEQVAELAAQPAVRTIDLVPPGQPQCDLVRTAVHLDGLVAKVKPDKRGGKGVVVGVIDTGIDGSHPAFTGRIHAVWDQSGSGSSPAAAHPSNAAYTAFKFGTELTGAAVSGSVDTNGHGSHVAGIAAGAEVQDPPGTVVCPAGMAPKATIVAVRAIGVNGGNWTLGVNYVAQKAAELGLPYVINMSFGQHFHAHDGSDLPSRGIFGVLTDATRTYKPGQVVVAAAGNDRGRFTHLRRSVPAAGTGVGVGTFRVGAPSPTTPPAPPAWPATSDVLNIWIKNPMGVCPLTFPLDLMLTRVDSSPVGVDTTSKVRLGGGVGVFPFPHLATQVVISSSLSDAVNGDFNFQVQLTSMSTASPPGPMAQHDWRVILVNGSRFPLDVHAWIANSPQTTSTFTGTPGADDEAFKVLAPAASAAAISVGGSTTRSAWTATGGAQNFGWPLNELSPFSNAGPLRDASIPPPRVYGVTHEINGVDVTAPGAFLQAPLSAQAPVDPRFQINSRSQVLAGTSMASPVVTGLVANLLAEEPGLTLPQVLERLKRSSKVPATSAFPPPAPAAGAKAYSRDWGYGLIDASSDQFKVPLP